MAPCEIGCNVVGVHMPLNCNLNATREEEMREEI